MSNRLQRLQRLRRPARLGLLRRTTPVSERWGFDRGTPIDRYYIEQFLEENRADIHGRVLEVQSSAYAERFGAGVERYDVLDVDATNPRATIVADLAAAADVPAATFDCFILTQTLHLIYDLRSALGHSHRVLRPGGVLLLTVPSVSRISRGAGLGGDFWRLTPAACSALLAETFGVDRATVRAYGNVLTAIAFLTGLAQEELSQPELDAHDDNFPVLVAGRAVKG